MSAAPAWMEPLLRRLEAEAPADALLRRRLPRTRLERATAAALPAQRFALALAVETLETLAAADARALLAALRDLEAPHVVLLVDLARSPLDETALRALGFRPHARDSAQALFGFELFGYKDRPEWLSPQHWAHPELWEKFRW